MITTLFNDKEQIFHKETVMEDIRYFRECGKHLQADVVEECFQIYIKNREKYKMKTNTIVNEV